MKQYPPIIRALAVSLLLVTVVFCVVMAQNILEPLVLGGLFAFLLFPVSARLESWKIPRIAANLIVILLSLGLLAGMFFFMVELFSGFLNDLPRIREQTLANVTKFNEVLYERFGISAERQNEGVKDYLRSMMNRNLTGMKVFSTTTTSVVKLAMLPVYTFMFLYYRDKFRDFLLDMAKTNQERWEKTMHEVAQITPQYMGGSVIVVLILAILNSLGFWIIGLDQPILFGVVAALFNIIPYIGTVFGYLLAALFAITSQSLGVAGAVVIQFFIVQFLENNILTPNITGSRVKLNPLVVILGLFVGSQMWGIVGMLVIVPILAMLKIIFEHSESLRPISYLMGTQGTEEHALNSAKIMRFGQKLWKKLRGKSD